MKHAANQIRAMTLGHTPGQNKTGACAFDLTRGVIEAGGINIRLEITQNRIFLELNRLGLTGWGVQYIHI